MYEVIIERDTTYIGYIDTFSIELQDKEVSITHEGKGPMNLDTEPKTIKMPLEEYAPFAEVFDNIDFSKILEEHDVLRGYDGWFLNCTVIKGMTKITVSLWCPEEDPQTPESTKLLLACEKICSLFGEEL